LSGNHARGCRPAVSGSVIHRDDCRECCRLTQHLDAVRAQHPGYYCAPVAPFGARRPELLIVGLAPGMHGANATGRPFTGDFAGILLYRTLHEFGFSNRPQSRARDDGLILRRCRITNAVRCLPPQNRPSTAEIRNCNTFLAAELRTLASRAVLLALGRIAHDAVLRAADLRPARFPFQHGAVHAIAPGRWLVDSYHCSRYNTQTRRLTEEMFRNVFQKIHSIISLRP
jgi:uracil-DNA glycosylase family 4